MRKVKLGFAIAALALTSGCATLGAVAVPDTPCGKAALARSAAEATIRAIDRLCPLADEVVEVEEESADETTVESEVVE